MNSSVRLEFNVRWNYRFIIDSPNNWNICIQISTVNYTLFLIFFMISEKHN